MTSKKSDQAAYDRITQKIKNGNVSAIVISFKADLANCENFNEISKFRQTALKNCARLEFDAYGQEIIGYDEKGFGKVAELIQFTGNGKFKFHFIG